MVVVLISIYSQILDRSDVDESGRARRDVCGIHVCLPYLREFVGGYIE